MNYLVTNDYFGTPLLWEYDEGLVERVDLVDFNTQEIMMNNELEMMLPYDIYDQVIKYIFEKRLSTRNFGDAFKICTIDRRTCRMFYEQIYGTSLRVSIKTMIARLSKTFQIGEAIHEEYLCAPNSSNSALNAIAMYRQGSLRYYQHFNPWDFRCDIEVQKLNLDPDDALANIFTFPGHFFGDTLWLHGSESDGIYRATKISHPVIILILCDFSYSLIPTYRSLNINWYSLVKFFRRAFGPRTGVYFMIKREIDAENPFIEVTDFLVQLT